MIARHFLPRAQAPQANALDRLERLLGRRAGDGYVDYPAMADRRSSLAESLSALGLFSVLIAVLTAGSVIGRGYAYSDVVVLLAIQTATALTVWRFGWQRVSEPWLLAVVGAQAVFVASLITLTGGPAFRVLRAVCAGPGPCGLAPAACPCRDRRRLRGGD